MAGRRCTTPRQAAGAPAPRLVTLAWRAGRLPAACRSARDCRDSRCDPGPSRTGEWGHRLGSGSDRAPAPFVLTRSRSTSTRRNVALGGAAAFLLSYRASRDPSLSKDLRALKPSSRLRVPSSLSCGDRDEHSTSWPARTLRRPPRYTRASRMFARCPGLAISPSYAASTVRLSG